MKKNSLLIIILAFFSANASAKYVRFAVNVSNTVVAQNDVYLTSSFQTLKNLGTDFQSGFIQMTQHPTDTNLYYYTVNLPAFKAYEYQVEKGVDGYEKEWVPVESRSPNEYRWIYLDSLSNDTLKLPEVFFGENNTRTDTMYRFQVNMSNEIIAATGVHIAGDFQGNNPITTRMYSFANNIYEYIGWFSPGSSQSYKFFNGNSMAVSEIVPSSCATVGKRKINSITNAQILPVVCFSGCSNCFSVGIKDIQSNNSILLSPNPANGFTTIQFNDDLKEHSILIMDIYGKAVRSILVKHQNEVRIDTEQLPPSIYFIRVSSEANTIGLKLIIE
jgi:Secretion system C-terminal sorting domain